ncbi:conserved Plasmodium protein, unknown function [Plasmodium vivax]|uniref:Uncharacterized protein n=1 Tax=Plasmodium vivax TaxID=5855 RepID=A0A1G4HDA8_PLAVI|nr:conserved Plasmodium protein, unknown function [Plasmodium vivax]
MVDNEYHDVLDTSDGVNPLDGIGKRAANWNPRGPAKTKSDATHDGGRRHTAEMKGTTSRSGSINLYNNITDSLSKLKTIIKYDQENDVDKGGGETQQGKAHEGGHCKLVKDGSNDAAKYPFLGGTETAGGDPAHRQRDERKAHRTNNKERELLRSIAKANSLKKIEKNISLLLRSDDEEGGVEEEEVERHVNRLEQPPQQHYGGSDGCEAVGRGTGFAPRRDHHQGEGSLPNQPYPSTVQTGGQIRSKNYDEAVEMNRDVNYRAQANYQMGGNLGSLERIPQFSSTGSKDNMSYSNHLAQSGYIDRADTDMAHSTDGPAGKDQLDLSLMSTEDLKKEFTFYSLSEKNSVHKFSLHKNDMLDLSQMSNFSNLSNFSNFSKFSKFSNGMRGPNRPNFARGSKPKEATMSESNTSVSSFTFNGNVSNLVGRDLVGGNDHDERGQHGQHGERGISPAIHLNSDHGAHIQGRVLSAAANGLENKSLSKRKKPDLYIAMDNTSSNSGTYYENSLKSNRSNLGTSRQNTLDESHRTYVGSGDSFDPNLSHSKVDKNALPVHINFHTKKGELNESLYNPNGSKTNRSGNSSWVQIGEAASLKSSGTFVSKSYRNMNSSNNVVDLAHSQVSVRARGTTSDHVMDQRSIEKRKENAHLGSNIDFDNNIFKNYNKEKKLEEGKKCGSDVEGRLHSEDMMSEVLTHNVSSGKAAVKDETDGTLPISEDDVDRKNINEIYKKINSISMLNDLSLNKLESLNSSIMDVYTKSNEEGKFLDDVILDDSIFIRSSSLYREGGSPHGATPHAVTPHAVTPHAATPHAATPHAATPHAATPHAATPHAASPQGELPPDDYQNRFSFSSDPDAADSLFKISLSCNEVVLPIGEASRPRGDIESTHSNRADVGEAKKEQQRRRRDGPTPNNEGELEANHCQFKPRAEVRETTEEESRRRSNSINQLKEKYSKREDLSMEKENENENEKKLSELPSQLDKNMLLKNTLTLQRSYNSLEWRKSKTATLDQFATPSSDLLPNEGDPLGGRSISRSPANKTDTINRFSKHDVYVHDMYVRDDGLSKKGVDSVPNLLLSKSGFANCPYSVGKPADVNNPLGRRGEDAPDDRHAPPSREYEMRSEPNSFSISNYSSLSGKATKGDPVNQVNSFSSVFPHDDKASNGDPSHSFRGSTSGGGMRRKRSISDCEGESASASANVYNDGGVDRAHSGNANGLGESSANHPQEGGWANGGASTGGAAAGGRHSMFFGASRSGIQSSGKMEGSKLSEAKGGRGSSEESLGAPNDLVLSKRESHSGVNHASGTYPCEEMFNGGEEGARFTAHTDEDTNHRRNLSYEGPLMIEKLGQSQNGNPHFLRQLSRGSDSQRSSSFVRSNEKEAQPNEGKFFPLDKKTTLEESKVPPMVHNKSVEGINYGSQRSREDEIKHSGMTSVPDILHFGENNNSSVFFFDNIYNSSEYDCIPKPLHSSYFGGKRKVSLEEGGAAGEGQTTFQPNENPLEGTTKGNASRTSPLSEGNPLTTRSSMNGSARYVQGENENKFEEDIMRKGATQGNGNDEGVPDRQGYLTKQTRSWKGLQRSSSSVLLSGPSGEITPPGDFTHDPTVKENTREDRRGIAGAIFAKEGAQKKGPIDRNSTPRGEGGKQRSIDQEQSQKGMAADGKSDGRANGSANDALETCSTSYSFEKSEGSGIYEKKGPTGKPHQHMPQEAYKICEQSQRGSRNVAIENDSANVGGVDEEKSNTRKVAVPPSEEKRKEHPNCYDGGDNSPFAHGEEKGKRRVSPCSGHRESTFAGEEKSGNGYTGKKGSTNGFPPPSMPDDVHEEVKMHSEHQRRDTEKAPSGENISGGTHPRSGSNREDSLEPKHFYNKPSGDYQMEEALGGRETDYMEGQNYEETSIRNTQYGKNTDDFYGDPYRCRSGQGGYTKRDGDSHHHAGNESETFLSSCRGENYTSQEGDIGEYPYGNYFSRGKREDEFYSNRYHDEVRSNGEPPRSGALSEDAYLGAVKVERAEQNRGEARSGRGVQHRGDKEEHGGGFQAEKNPLGGKVPYEGVDSLGGKDPYGRLHSLGDKDPYERITPLHTIQPHGRSHPREGETKMNAHIFGGGRGTHPSGLPTEGDDGRHRKEIVVERINEMIVAPDRMYNRTDSANPERKNERNTYDHAGGDFPPARPSQDYPYGRCQSRDAHYPHEQAGKGHNSRGGEKGEIIPTNPYQLKKDEQFEAAMTQHKYYSKNGTQHYEDETSQPIYPFTELLPNDMVHSGHLGSLPREEGFVNRVVEGNVREKYSSLGGCEGYENWPQREGVIGERGSERYGPSWSGGGDYRYGGFCGEGHPGERHYEGKHPADDHYEERHPGEENYKENHPMEWHPGEDHYEEKHYEERHHRGYPPLYENFDRHSAMVAPPNKVEKSKTNVKIGDHNYISSGSPYGAEFHTPVMPNGTYVKAQTSYVAYGGGTKWKGNSTQPLGYAHLGEKKEPIYNYKEAHVKYDFKREMYEGKHTGSPHECGQFSQVDGRSNTALPHDYFFDEGARSGAVQRHSKYAPEELPRKGEPVMMPPRFGESKGVDGHKGVATAPTRQYSGRSGGNSGGDSGGNGRLAVPLHYEMNREDNTHGMSPQMGDNYPNENKTWSYREGRKELPFRKANTNYEHYRVGRDMASNGDDRIFRHSEGDTMHRGGLPWGGSQVDHNASSGSERNANYNELLYELFRENMGSQGKEKSSQVLNKIMDVMMNIQNDLKDVKCKLSRKKKGDPQEGGEARGGEVSGEPSGEVSGQPGGGVSGKPHGEVVGKPRAQVIIQPCGEVIAHPPGEETGKRNSPDGGPPANNPELDASLTPVLKNLNHEDVKDSAVSKSNRLYLFSKFFTSVFYEHNVKTHNFIMFNIYNTEQKRQTHKVSLFLERDYNDIYSLAYNNLLFYAFDCYSFYKYIKTKFQGNYKIYENSTLCLYIQNNYETNLINRLFIEQNNLHKSRFCLNEKRILKTCTKYVVESFLSLLDKQVNIKNVIPFMKKRSYEIDQKNLYFFISRFNLMDKIFSDSHGFECNRKAFERCSPNVRNFAVFFKRIRDASDFYDSLVGGAPHAGEAGEAAQEGRASKVGETGEAAPPSRSYRLIIVALHKGKSFHYDKAPFSSFISSKQSDMHRYYNSYDSMSFSNDEVVLFNLSYAVPFYYIEYHRN